MSTTFEGGIIKGLNVRRGRYCPAECSPCSGSSPLVLAPCASGCQQKISQCKGSSKRCSWVTLAFQFLPFLSLLLFLALGIFVSLFVCFLIGVIYLEEEQWSAFRSSCGINSTSFCCISPRMSRKSFEAAQPSHLIPLHLGCWTCKIKGFTTVIPSK